MISASKCNLHLYILIYNAVRFPNSGTTSHQRPVNVNLRKGRMKCEKLQYLYKQNPQSCTQAITLERNQ